MTYEELRASTKEFLTPRDVAPLLGCAAYTLNVAAKERPDLLGFPVVIMGTRVKFPRRAFIRFMEGRGEDM